LFVTTYDCGSAKFEIYDYCLKYKVSELSEYNSEYINLTVSNNRDKVILSCDNEKVRIVNIKERKNPKLLYEFNCVLGTIHALDWHLSDEVVVMGGQLPLIQIHFVQEKKQLSPP